MPWLSRPARRHAIRALGAAAAIAVLASACSSSSSGSPSAASTSATKSAITIPVIGDFTGADAFFGTGQVEGMQPALQTLNKAGGIDGHPVKLDECDTQSTVAGATQCASKFSGDPLVLAVSVIANIKAAQPSLSSSLFLASTNLLNPPRSSNAFQVAPAGAAVDDTVDQVARASHFSTIGVIATDDAVGEAQIGFIKAAAGSLKLNIQFVSDTATDDTVALEKLVSANVPMIYAAALGTAGTAVIKGYDELHPSMPLVVTGADASYGFLKGISSFEPSTNLYTIPGTPLVPGDITNQSRSAMSAYVKTIKASVGHAPDTIDVSGAYAIDVAIALLKAVGLSSTLAAKEAWLHKATISSLTSVSFSNPALNVLSNVPPGFDKINGTTFSAASTDLP
jgi:ABC-type branched-subunit amino acid transport system substrate-binding protein